MFSYHIEFKYACNCIGLAIILNLQSLNMPALTIQLLPEFK